MISLLIFAMSGAPPPDCIGWVHPTERVGGDKLAITEISHTEIWVNGKKINELTPRHTKACAFYAPALNCFQLKTVDTEGRKADFSKKVCI